MAFIPGIAVRVTRNSFRSHWSNQNISKTPKIWLSASDTGARAYQRSQGPRFEKAKRDGSEVPLQIRRSFKILIDCCPVLFGFFLSGSRSFFLTHSHFRLDLADEIDKSTDADQ